MVFCYNRHPSNVIYLIKYTQVTPNQNQLTPAYMSFPEERNEQIITFFVTG